MGVYATFKRVVFTGPTLANNANESEFRASVYAKCISISIFQLANSTAVAAGSRAAGGS